jgi:hypothetical protein
MSANAIIAHGAGKELLRTIYELETQNRQSKEDVVSVTMRHLEKLANVNPIVACYLMTKLWDIAGDLYMHNICDAVDLYIYHNNSKLLSILQQGQKEENNIILKNKYNEWIKYCKGSDPA